MANLRPPIRRTLASEAFIALLAGNTVKCWRALSGQFPSAVVVWTVIEVVVAVVVDADVVVAEVSVDVRVVVEAVVRHPGGEPQRAGP